MRNHLLFVLSTCAMLLLVAEHGLRFASPWAQESPQIASAIAIDSISAVTGFATSSRAMMTGRSGWRVTPLFTVGEEVDGYRPPGILDGIGAMEIRPGVVRFFVNHELDAEDGYAYRLGNRTEMTGARVSYLDVDADTRIVMDAGLAYDRAVDKAGREVTDPTQIHEGKIEGSEKDGYDRFCSSNLYTAGEYGLADDVYFCGEEVRDGLTHALDIHRRTIYALPWLGRGTWENVTLLDTGDSDKVAVLLGDDRRGAPLYLYVGRKGTGGFLERNGLTGGDMFVWVANNGDRSPEDWNGTGTSRAGMFVKIDIHAPERAGRSGYDELGFATQARQDEWVDAVGGFRFSRPEDVATNPERGTQAVMASTGHGAAYPSDDWGATYIIDADIGAMTATIRIVYDGDDAGDGQFTHPDMGLRNPDNLDWAENGMIYVQEDRSTRKTTFGKKSGMEASVWELDPATGKLVRIAVIDRSALPPGQTDSDPTDLGDWESSGVLDVTRLFATAPGEVLLVGNVQAHSIRDGDIKQYDLVQGGQIVFFSTKR